MSTKTMSRDLFLEGVEEEEVVEETVEGLMGAVPAEAALPVLVLMQLVFKKKEESLSALTVISSAETSDMGSSLDGSESS